LKSPKIGKPSIDTLIIPQGLLIHEKNQISKISCYFPLSFLLAQPFFILKSVHFLSIFAHFFLTTCTSKWQPILVVPVIMMYRYMWYTEQFWLMVFFGVSTIKYLCTFLYVWSHIFEEICICSVLQTFSNKNLVFGMYFCCLTPLTHCIGLVCQS